MTSEAYHPNESARVPIEAALAAMGISPDQSETRYAIETHNMVQARRASEERIFMLLGRVIGHEETARLFLSPSHEGTADYIEGRYG